MKKLALFFCLLCVFSITHAQSDTTMKKFVDSVCKCMSKIDMNTIKSEADAQQAMTACFVKDNMSVLMKVADERNIDITDQAAMRKIGEEVGLELVKQNCQPFIQLSMQMAKANKSEVSTSVTTTSSGTLSSIETKDFCKFIVTDNSGRRNTFYWLHHFKNSEKFMDQPAKYVGKKLKVSWQETEVYIPAAKGYFKIKEITTIELL